MKYILLNQLINNFWIKGEYSNLMRSPFSNWGKIKLGSSCMRAQKKNALSKWKIIEIVVSFIFSLIVFSNQAISAENDEKLDFNIPKQTAFLSLIQFAEQADITFMFPVANIENVETNLVVGKYTSSEALELLLEGTELEVISDEKGKISIFVDPSFERHNMFNHKKSKIAASVFAVLSTVANAQVATSDTTSHEEANTQEVEVISVSGIRQSLTAVADFKKNSNFIQDSIVAEDIGKFPDANVAESLQRISGVSIDRSGGEGQQITVRGFGPQFNTVLVNGRRMASDAEGRAFNFDLLSAELIGSVDVFKTSSVALQEGGIGSTINLKTQRPLDIGKFKAVVSAKGAYEDKSNEVTPNLFGFISNTFADDKVGVLLSISHQERKATLDSSITSWSPDSQRFDPWVIGEDDLWRFADGQGNGVGNYVYQRQHNFMRTEEDRTRTGYTGTVQFAISDDMTLTFDGMYTDFDIKTQAISRISHRNKNDLHNMLVDENNVVTRYDMIEGPMNVYQARNRPATAGQFGANLEWFINDQLSANVDISTSSSENPAAGKDYYVVVRASDKLQRIDNSQGTDAPLQTNFNFTPSSTDLNGDGLVNQFDYVLGEPVEVADVNDQASWFGQREGFTFEDDIDEAKIDIKWLPDHEYLTQVTFGAIASSQEKTRVNKRSPDPQFYLLNRVPLPASLFTSVNRQDFLSAANGDFANDSVYFDPEALLAYYSQPETLVLRDELNGLAPGTSAATFQSYDAIVDPSRSYNVQEDILSAYVNAMFEFDVSSMPLTINAGLRFTDTSVDSTGANRVFLDLAPAGTTGDVLISTLGAPEEVTASADYRKWLPSVNAKLDVTDEIVLRAAYSKTLTRPDMTLLNPAPAFAQQVRLSSLEATAGNPDLSPFLANNYDVSFEWYYNQTSYLTVGYFRKDIDGFIVSGIAREPVTLSEPNSLDLITEDRSNIDGNTIYFDITRPRNLEKTSVDGFEIGFQHTFDSLPGLLKYVGFSANLTFVSAEDEFDVNVIDNNIALPGLGDSQNIVLFYDDTKIEARIAYNNREEFFTRLQGVEPWFTEQYDQIDARVAYNITKDIQVFVEGTNLTDSFTRQHGRYDSQFLSLESSGPRYAMGVRASF
ncbi:TonB-dependent receptor [Paraglaciecola mesophila]|nr:TonB-dependent receptor [Paraglaciecola mesophila]